MSNAMRLKYFFWKCSEEYGTRHLWRKLPFESKTILLDMIEQDPDIKPDDKRIAALGHEAEMIMRTAIRLYSDENARKFILEENSISA